MKEREKEITQKKKRAEKKRARIQMGLNNWKLEKLLKMIDPIWK